MEAPTISWRVDGIQKMVISGTEIATRERASVRSRATSPRNDLRRPFRPSTGRTRPEHARLSLSRLPVAVAVAFRIARWKRGRQRERRSDRFKKRYCRLSLTSDHFLFSFLSGCKILD